MRRVFCTLFDSGYLLKGLALYRSLARHAEDFELHVLCMDDEAYALLCRLDEPALAPHALDDFLDEELASVRPTRSRGEFCWTCTPSLPLYLLRRCPSLDMVTYLDADLMFFASPEAIFSELDDASIGLVEHRYSAGLQVMAETHGTFNVECMSFRNDARGLAALEWWRARCNEWCYNRAEDGKFGDQKYLDDWPDRFDGVRVIEGKGVGLAPWNIENYTIEAADGNVTVDGEPLVFYHYHQFALLDDGTAYRPTDGGFAITPGELRLIYRPYLQALRDELARVRRLEPGFSAGIERRDLRTRLRDAGEAARLHVRALKPR